MVQKALSKIEALVNYHNIQECNEAFQTLKSAVLAQQSTNNTGSPKFPEWKEVQGNMLRYLSSQGKVVTDDIANTVHQSFEFIARSLTRRDHVPLTVLRCSSSVN
jgi:hypothetical protein